MSSRKYLGIEFEYQDTVIRVQLELTEEGPKEILVCNTEDVNHSVVARALPWQIAEGRAVIAEKVFDDKYNLVHYARTCSVTGEGMNEGWYCEGGQFDMYFKYKKHARKYAFAAGYLTLKAARNAGYMYWTDWTDNDE